MTHLYEARAYEDAARADCAWRIDDDWPALDGAHRTDVAIIGAGVTGLNAALTLAQNGMSVTVLEAHVPGWGASGRNGGFCCIGGAKLSGAQLSRRFGDRAATDFAKTQLAAIDHVAQVIGTHGIEAHTHSAGEVQLAHRPRHQRAFAAEAEVLARLGVEADVLTKQDLGNQGLDGPGFYGALHVRAGFGLDPGAYVTGLARAAARAGARIHGHTPVTDVTPRPSGQRLDTPTGQITADRVIIATNGYTPERLGPLRAPVLPVQSSVLVTRPLTTQEQAAQNWRSDLMAYDTRNLLHYFRLMPDGRFLFGMRGGVRASAGAEARTLNRLTAHFHALFPAWRHVEIPHRWSGLLAFSRDLLPHVGEIPGTPGAIAAMAYHGNGVAMGSWSGHAAARLVLGDDIRPAVMRRPLKPFPLAPLRRNILRVTYPLAALADLV